ncbi:MAG: winged helix-turn-helix transcriptional regulator [Candidatus Liptonbacteria bacterium]|nr:winged helix-turn-helix transcriptional regulator [Candidatus Liptonbacteria bacterium]
MEKSLKALANRRRLAILKYLKNTGESSVGDVAQEIHLSFKSTSRHLAVLHGRDIVEREQRSSQAFYRLAASHVPAVQRIISLL